MIKKLKEYLTLKESSEVRVQSELEGHEWRSLALELYAEREALQRELNAVKERLWKLEGREAVRRDLVGGGA